MTEKFDPLDVEMAPTLGQQLEIINSEEARIRNKVSSAAQVTGEIAVQKTATIDTELQEPKPDPHSTDWMVKGKCREVSPGTFFPDSGVGVDVARKICSDCPVKSPCLEYALVNRIDHGIWGGASERERRRILRQRRLDGNPIPNKPRSYTVKKK